MAMPDTAGAPDEPGARRIEPAERESRRAPPKGENLHAFGVVTEYRATDKSRHSSAFCQTCENPPCNVCGKEYDQKRAFKAGEGKKV